MDINHLLTLLTDFLLHPDKGWSFCTVPFWVLFLVFYAVYLLLCRSRRPLMLSYVIVFSLFFAWKANGILMLLLPGTAVLSWWLTDVMRKTESNGKRKALLWTNIVLTLLPLVYYKYANFLLLTFSTLLQGNFAPLDIFLPIGISFYTFQAISYTVDVYKQKFTLPVNLLEYFFYLTFFPLLMAGPITRADVLFPQIKAEPRHDNALVYGGLWLIICGLIKKALIADYIAGYNNWIFDAPTSYSGFEDLMGVFGYTLQIYCDFSGYSDIAIGCARLFGFNLMRNFNYPYFSRSIPEFWRRWHISLMTWLRDYIYFPLGGSRCSRPKIIRNVFIVWALSGLWHGADWTFVCWGLYHATLLAIYIILGINTKYQHSAAYGRLLPSIKEFLQMAMTFVLAVFGWMIFRAESMEQAIGIFKAMASNEFYNSSVVTGGTYLLFGIIALAVEWLQREKQHALQFSDIRPFNYRAVRWAVYYLIIVILFIYAGTGQTFIYFQF